MAYPYGRLSLPALRSLAILLPLLFLIGVDLVRQTLLPPSLEAWPGVLVIYGFAAGAVALFAFAVFAFVGSIERALIERNRQLSSLNDLAIAAAGNLELDELLSTGLDHAVSAMHSDAGIICLVDLEHGEHSAVCVRGVSDELARRVQQAKLSEDPVAYALVTTGRPVMIERVLSDPRLAEAAAREGIRSLAGTPLRASGEVNGVLVVATKEREHRFTDVDRAFLEGIGGQLGLVIRNAVLYRQTERRNRELAALLAVGRAISEAPDTGQMARQSLEAVVAVTSVDAAELWLVEGQEVVLRCHSGANSDAFFEQRGFRLGDGAVGLAAAGERVVIDDLSDDRQMPGAGAGLAGLRTFCALPVRQHGRPVGVLAVAAREPAAVRDEGELRLLESIAEWLAVGIENAQLNERVMDVGVLRERERLAREMHDGLAQVLGYINTQTLAVKKLLADRRLEEARGELERMEDAARGLYAEVRQAILGLRLAPHRDGGLVRTLEAYLEQYGESFGIDAVLVVADGAESAGVDQAAELQLMRIAQEALSNVRRHSGAASARVELRRDDDTLTLAVVDHGSGFALGSPSGGRPRFGLQTMRERAESIGATLSIESAPGAGTRVEVCLPLERPRVAVRAMA